MSKVARKSQAKPVRNVRTMPYNQARGRASGAQLLLPPTYKSNPIYQRKLRFLNLDGSALAFDITGAGLLSLMATVSAGSGTSTSICSSMAAVRVKRIAVYANIPTVSTSTGQAIAASVTLEIPGGAYAPAQILESQGLIDGCRPIIYVPGDRETLGFWMNWDSIDRNEVLFRLVGAKGFTVDLDIEFTLDCAGSNKLAHWTTVNPQLSGMYVCYLGQFDSGGGASGLGLTPFGQGVSEVAATAYTVV